jgi:hypothetical protein
LGSSVGARDPVAFCQLTNNFKMGVLADLADQGFATTLRHPVFRFDFFARLQVDFICCAYMGLRPQTRSMIIATPWPTPTHMVQSA